MTNNELSTPFKAIESLKIKVVNSIKNTIYLYFKKDEAIETTFTLYDFNSQLVDVFKKRESEEEMRLY